MCYDLVSLTIPLVALSGNGWISSPQVLWVICIIISEATTTNNLVWEMVFVLFSLVQQFLMAQQKWQCSFTNPFNSKPKYILKMITNAWAKNSNLASQLYTVLSITLCETTEWVTYKYDQFYLLLLQNSKGCLLRMRLVHHFKRHAYCLKLIVPGLVTFIGINLITYLLFAKDACQSGTSSSDSSVIV